MRTLEQVYAAIQFGSLRCAEETMVELEALRAAVDSQVVEVSFSSDAPDTERQQSAQTMPAPYTRAA